MNGCLGVTLGTMMGIGDTGIALFFWFPWISTVVDGITSCLIKTLAPSGLLEARRSCPSEPMTLGSLL